MPDADATRDADTTTMRFHTKNNVIQRKACAVAAVNANHAVPLPYTDMAAVVGRGATGGSRAASV